MSSGVSTINGIIQSLIVFLFHCITIILVDEIQLTNGKKGDKFKLEVEHEQ